MKGKMKLGWVLGASAQLAVPPAIFVPPVGELALVVVVAFGAELHAANNNAATMTDNKIVTNPLSRRMQSLAFLHPGTHVSGYDRNVNVSRPFSR
jgi:hypothetical protein